MILYILSQIGVAVFASSGALAAGRKKFDLMGVVVIAMVTAIGGGTIRDVLLNRPVFWINDPVYLWVSLAAACVTFASVKFYRPPAAVMLVADALGLALFTISGTHLSEQAQLPGIICVVMGALTGVAGGALRDVLSGEIPIVFKSTETLYATAAICGSALYLVLQILGLGATPASLCGMVAIVGLRFLAIYWQLRLPELEIEDDPA